MDLHSSRARDGSDEGNFVIGGRQWPLELLLLPVPLRLAFVLRLPHSYGIPKYSRFHSRGEGKRLAWGKTLFIRSGSHEFELVDETDPI